MTRPRARWKAVILSLLVPGLGHLYAGGLKKFYWRFATMLVASSIFLILLYSFPIGPASFPIALLLLAVVYIWIAVDAGRVAAAAPEDYELRPFNQWYVYVALIILHAILWEVGAWRGMEAYRIPSGAMEPTLLIGDFVFARVTEAARRDVTLESLAIFESVEERGLTIVKRVVAVAGDTLAMVDGSLLRNGNPVWEPYVGPALDPVDVDPEDPKMRAWQVRYLMSEADPRRYRPTLKNWGPLVVPPDSVFVLGDNRDRSYDSRYYGFVGRDRILGHAHMIYFSYDRNGVLPLPFLTAIRWSRMGTRFSAIADPPNTR